MVAWKKIIHPKTKLPLKKSCSFKANGGLEIGNVYLNANFLVARLFCFDGGMKKPIHPKSKLPLRNKLELQN